MTRALALLMGLCSIPGDASADEPPLRLTCQMAELCIDGTCEQPAPFAIDVTPESIIVFLPQGALIARASGQPFPGAWAGIVETPGFTALATLSPDGDLAVSAHSVMSDGRIGVMNGIGQCKEI